MAQRLHNADIQPTLGPDLISESNDNKPDTRTAEEIERIRALKSMLDVSAARAEQAAKRRRPVLVAGAQVRVIAGPYANEEGTVQDADYIASRVLVALPSQSEPMWIDFKLIGPCK